MVDGIGDPEKNGAGIGLNGAHAVEISGNTCYDNDDAGIGIRGGGCELIEANEAYQNGRAGIGLCQGTAVTEITNNHLHHNGMAGIGHDGTEGRVSVDIESGNTIHNNGMAGIGNMSSDIGVIAANESYENAEAGIGMQMGAAVDEITDNYLHHNLAAGIGHDGSQGRVSVGVESGNILANNGAAGIGNISSDIGLIEENESYQNGAAGIGLTAGATVGEIIDNDLHNNGAAGIGHSGGVVVTLESGNMISENSAAGLAIEGGSRVTEIRGCFVDYNRMPGITVVGGSVAGMIDDCTLDHNGTSCTTGMSVLGGSSAAVRNSTISYSGRTNISVLDAGTSASLENCTLDHASQCGSGPNITVQGADAILTGCNLAYTVGSPNIETSGSGTVLTMYGCNVTKSAKPGIVASGGAVLNIQNSVFDNNGTDGTVGMNISGCDITFKGTTICNSPHWGIMMGGCVGSIKECNIYSNASWGGGQLTIGSSNLDIVRNVLHDPAGLHNEIALLSGSDCRVYHNTIVGRSDGGGGPINQGPGDGVYVDGWSRADIRNNIFYRLPRGISPGLATVATVDNAAAEATENWYSAAELTGFAGTDYLVGPMGDGSETCTWNFTISAAGNYNVYAWWPAAYATNAPYTIYYHEGSETVRVNQTTGGSLWNVLGTYHFEPGTYSVVLSNDADADVVADSIQVARTADVTASTNCFYVMSGFAYKGIIGDNIIDSNPYLDANYYLDGYSPCVDGAEPIAGVNDVYSGNGPDVGAKEGEGIRGELLWKTPATLISTNNSNGWRLIDGDLSTGNNWGGGVFVYEIAGEDGMPVPVYGMRFFAGTYASNWRVYVADSPDGPWQGVTRVFAMEGGFGWLVGDEGTIWDEHPVDFFASGKYILLAKQYGPVGANSVYEFQIQTTPESIADYPDTFVVDNDAASFAGTWTAGTSTLGYYASNYRSCPAGTGAATATWTPEITTPGDYDVYARWTAYTNRATNAPYTINYDGASETIPVNQQANGGRWVYLGTYPFAAGTSGNVMLSDNADGYVIADGILFILK
ncbi:MAG: right-handed parallel beta-helix repeat-containing protein [Pseudomonadota bacterium]